jgi:hypothetical protein
VEEQESLNQLWRELPTAKAPAATDALDEQGEEIADFVFHAQNRVEYITLVRDMGFEVNDDNEPAPTNVPTLFGAPAPVNGGDLFEGQTWGWDGIDRRAILQGSMHNGPMFANEWSPNEKSFVEIFVYFFPRYFLDDTIINAMSNALLVVNAVRITFGELLRYIMMILLMSLCYAKSRDYFWRMATRTGDESEDKETDSPSFTINRYMSRRRYLAITSAMRFTLSPPPTFQDKFWQI